jgi:ABC-type spermidine/putrescine transport system permease subunit II
MTRASLGQYLLAIVIALFLVATLIVPVGAVLKSAFTNADGSLTLGHMASLFQVTLLRESFYNSLYVAVVTVLAAHFWWQAWENRWVSETMWRARLWIPYSAMPIGLGILTLQYIADFYCLIAGREPPFGIRVERV